MIDNPAKLADNVIAFLNTLLEVDRKAITKLFDGHRVSCNDALVNHHSVQVLDEGGKYSVGFLGILNGLVGTITDGEKIGWGHITMVIDETGLIKEFRRTA